MKKYELDYLKERVAQTVKCTNGTVSTKLQAAKLDDLLDTDQKLELIRSGKAKLRADSYLGRKEVTSYSCRLSTALTRCYTYLLTDEQKKARVHNKKIDDRINEIHLDIELEGRKIVDTVVLGIVDIKDIPDELVRLGEMENLASQGVNLK